LRSSAVVVVVVVVSDPEAWKSANFISVIAFSGRLRA
jgi:hypothetical protein